MTESWMVSRTDPGLLPTKEIEHSAHRDVWKANLACLTRRGLRSEAARLLGMLLKQGMLGALGFDKVRSLSEKINNKGMTKFVNTNVSHFGLCSFMFCSTFQKIKVNFVSS